MPRPFRFGVMTGGPARGREWLSSLVHWEQVGYTSALITDHVDSSAGLIASLSAAVSNTRSMIVGSLTAGVDFRHPVLLCKEMATLNRLWPGRIEMGLGAGWSARDYAQLGLRLDPSDRRIDRLREEITIVHKLLGGEPVTFHGKYFDLNDASLGTSGSGPIPMILGGGGRQMLHLAARNADIVSLNPQMTSSRPVHNSATLDATRAKAAYVKSEAGERSDQVELAIVVYHVFRDPTDDDAAFVSRSLGIDPVEVRATPHCLFGDAETMAASLVGLRETIGISYVMISDTHADDLAPVIDLLRGREASPGQATA